MSFSGSYPCMDYEDRIRLVRDKRKAKPSTVTKVFIEVQVREKRVYRTKSGILLNHLHVTSSHVEPPSNFLINWRWFQIDIDDLLAKDVFCNCCDVESLSTMSLGSNKDTADRFVKFFKGRVSSFCNKNAANIIETRPKLVAIVAQISTVHVYDLDNDWEAVHSLKVCDKSCVREANPYGAYSLPKGAFLFSPAHGSLVYNDSAAQFHRQTCAVCLDELLLGTHDIVVITCGHGFHSRCLVPWFNKVGTCPVCRLTMKQHGMRKRRLPIVKA